MLPLLEGEGWGEVCELSGKVTHLTLSLSFQEREPAPSRDPFSKKAPYQLRAPVPLSGFASSQP